MADISKTVEIVFGGKNELSKTIGGIERDFGQLDSAVGRIAAPLAGIADSILKVDAALLAMAIGGIALAVRESGKFGNTFGEITTLISATGAPIDKFRTDVLGYAGTSVKSLEEINKALYASISAGVDYTKSIEFVAAAEKLSVAGLANLGDTTKALVSTLNAYGAGTDQATKYSDIMFQTVKLGQTTLSELSVQLAKVTGLAANSGVPFETLAAAVAALTVAGLPTEQALTGIKAALQNIIKPTSESEKMAASLGLQFDATALKTKGFEGVLWDAWKATGGNTDKMAQLFGSVEALNAVLILASDKTGKFKDSLKAMGDAGGSTAAAYEKVVNSFENVNQRLENSFKLTLVAIGDKLMPQYADMANAMGDIMRGIKVGVDTGAFDPLFAFLDSVGASLVAQLKGIALALPDALKMIDFTGLLNALNQLGGAFGSFMGDLDLTKPKDLAAAIQLLIDGVTGLINITSGMVEAFRPFFNQIGEFLIKMAQSDEETQKTIGSVLLFAKAIQEMGLGVAAAIVAMEEFHVSIADVFSVVAGGAQIMFNGLQILLTGIKGMFLIVEGAVIGLADKLTLGLLPSLGQMSKVIEDQGKNIGQAFEKDAAEAKTGLDKMVAGFEALGRSAVENTSKTDKIRNRIDELGDSAANATPPIDSLEDELSELGKMVVAPSVTVDTSKVGDIEKVITGKLPKDVKVEVAPKTDEAKLKEQSAIIQKAMEFKAKVDIAQIESATKIIEATFKTLDTRITSSGSLLSEYLKALNDPKNSGSGKWAIQGMMEEEARHRKEAMEQAAKLTEQQIELNKLKLRALERGDSMISVKADGLKPHLEMIMWEVLEAIQIRASASQAEFLLGYE